jgi:hypothetical protein
VSNKGIHYLRRVDNTANVKACDAAEKQNVGQNEPLVSPEMFKGVTELHFLFKIAVEGYFGYCIGHVQTA